MTVCGGTQDLFSLKSKFYSNLVNVRITTQFPEGEGAPSHIQLPTALKEELNMTTGHQMASVRDGGEVDWTPDFVQGFDPDPDPVITRIVSVPNTYKRDE